MRLIFSLFLAALIFEITTDFPAILLSVILISAHFAAVTAFLISFFSGLAIELFSGKHFGSQTLFYTVVSLLIILYRRRFDTTNNIYLSVNTVLFVSIYLLLLRTLSIEIIFLLLSLVLLGNYFLKRLRIKDEGKLIF